MPSADICPVVAGYLSKLRSLVDPSNVLRADLPAQIDELEELAEATRAGPLERQHHRAFLCVELMLSRFLLVGLDHTQQAEKAALLDWPRSREGLNTVLKTVRALRDDITGSAMETDLVGVNRANIAQLRQAINQRLLSVIEVVIGAAEIVRASMKNPATRLGPVGASLAVVVAEQRRHAVWEAIWLGRVLLTETEQKVFRGWQIQKP